MVGSDVFLEVKGQRILVSEDYAAEFLKYKWSINSHGYVVRGINRKNADGSWLRKTFKLHRLIAGAAPGEIVDHINRNKLDNRKHNLRVTTNSMNVLNSERSDNAKGYYFSKVRDRWVIDCRRLHIRGSQFKTEEEAINYVKSVRSKRSADSV